MSPVGVHASKRFTTLYRLANRKTDCLSIQLSMLIELQTARMSPSLALNDREKPVGRRADLALGIVRDNLLCSYGICCHGSETLP